MNIFKSIWSRYRGETRQSLPPPVRLIQVPVVLPPGLRRFESDEVARDVLCGEIARQAAVAETRRANSGYWGSVGDVMLRAVAMASYIAEQPLTGDPNAYVTACHLGLLKLTSEFRSDPDDEDGYGVATVHEIRRVLEAP